MLPLQQAIEIRQSILEYLKATFAFKDREVQEAFFHFVEDEQEGMFKGPYVQLRLPFEQLSGQEEVPLEIAPPFKPYRHQFEAFQRLSTREDSAPRPTLLTTGTGSGKTESFLYPLLDYCYRRREAPGIKVIILYPMNALATDQAKRLAGAIYQDQRLQGQLTAGLFIGEGRDAQKFPRTMGPDHIIENRDTILASPPDILLTNFKMLDYGLLRANYHSLWEDNLRDPDLLRFLVLDELHTYDGAQGTDVANLIRRLKLKLDIPKGQLCPVGTSATLGTGADAAQKLTAYASQVFGEEFPLEAVITESRLSVDDLVAGLDQSGDPFIPRGLGIHQARMDSLGDYQDFLRRQRLLWQLPEAVSALGLPEELLRLQLVRDVLRLASERPISLQELSRKLAEINTAFARLPEWNEAQAFSPREEVIGSLLSLIAEARRPLFPGSERTLPFLHLQVQLWIRELSGVLRLLDDPPAFTWRYRLEQEVTERPAALPPYFCRECGASGWIGYKQENRENLETEAENIYQPYFNNARPIYYFNTAAPEHEPDPDYQPDDRIDDWIDKYSGYLSAPADSEDSLHVMGFRKLNRSGTHTEDVCPECGTTNTITVIGTRVATLSSIVVSQAMASDMDERSEPYRKILAFTNSVQDAAHQAGFVESRNFRFTLRTALQKVINSREGHAWKLPELADRFLEDWKEKDGEEAFYFRFYPSDLERRGQLTDYQDGRGRYSRRFREEFDLRMRWEIYAEFGYNALIGRTLEKTASSAASFPEDPLIKVYRELRPWLEENLMGVIRQEDFLRFMTGFLYRFRTRGGVDHPFLEKFRNGDLKLWDLNWQRDQRHFLNRNFGPRTRLPKLLTTRRHERKLLDATYTQAENWYHRYLRKTIPLLPDNPVIFNEFYERLLELLEDAGWVNKAQASRESSYALLPEIIRVENEVVPYACAQCGHRVHLGSRQTAMAGASCLNYHCTGHYEQQPKETTNYYNLVYNRRRAPRIHASEHTGLLDRKQREEVEARFKGNATTDNLNTLVATSTLEMGIDVGDLNHAINNSAPPLPSNFLQRIGRAGRRSGAAVLTHFAQNKSHDLYYFNAPMEMMAGEVQSPGCYLNAREILQRHLMAYFFDAWARKNPGENRVPAFVRDLRLMGTDLNDPSFFLNRFLGYVNDHRSELLERFAVVYQSDLEPEVLNDLVAAQQIDGLLEQMRRAVSRLKEELRGLLERKKEIEQRRSSLNEQEPEKQELKRELRSLGAQQKTIGERLTLEFFTNVGLLPNYAFPETGAVLSARVYYPSPEGAEGEPRVINHEIVRAGSVALKDFAPGNTFYGQGRRLEITGLPVNDWRGDRSELQSWRFCSNCDYRELDKTEHAPVCPVCQHESFGAATNTHEVAPMRGAVSSTTRERSTLDDASDDREHVPYRMAWHWNFADGQWRGGIVLRDEGFGMEFIRQVEVTRVNLGLDTDHSTANVQVQRQELPRHGFVTCRYCGKSTPEPALLRAMQPNFNRYNPLHYPFCNQKEHDYLKKPDEVFREVWLSQRMTTEVLKILLPILEVEGEDARQLFQAVIRLGLKQYYQGDPDHIQFQFYEEYNPQTTRFDQYLILYDGVPGGTGYLEKLKTSKVFNQILRLAYERVQSCACQHQGKDGCYHCILSYADQFHADSLSRREAERILKSLLDHADNWETLDHRLSDIASTGGIEESELERRFIRLLKLYARFKSEAGWQFEEVQEEVLNYRLTLPLEDGSIGQFIIRPQVELGPARGVRYSTRPDFLISLVHITPSDGQEQPNAEMLEERKKIALFLDGFEYHAKGTKLRFYDDIKKRRAILDSQEFLSWTLTWSDLDLLESEIKNGKAEWDQLAPLPSVQSEVFSKIVELQPEKREVIKMTNNVTRLFQLLTLGQDRFSVVGGAFQLCLQPRFPGSVYGPEEVDSYFDFGEPVDPNHRGQATRESWVPSLLQLGGALFRCRVMTQLHSRKVRWAFSLPERTEVDKMEWELFWRMYNLSQFSDSIHFFEAQVPEEGNSAKANAESQLEELLELFGAPYRRLLRFLIQEDIPFNREGGFSLLGKQGVEAEAMLGFEHAKVVFDPFGPESQSAFERAGYRIETPQNFKPELLKV